MTEVELLDEWLEDLSRGVRHAVADLSPEALAWQPDAEANSIGVTVWHFSRWLDFIATRILSGRPSEEELWHTGGWAARTGYDPRGIGYLGLGAITGYTREQVAAIPTLSVDDLLAYHEQTSEALRTRLRALSPEALHGPAPVIGRERSMYSWLKVVTQGSFGHLGEVEALKALQARAHANTVVAG
jgi:hypothetical protein